MVSKMQLIYSLGYEEVNISMGADNIFDWFKGYGVSYV